MLKFTAQVIKGQGNGKKIGFPTINLELNPPDPLSFKGGVFEHGVYACKVNILNSPHLDLYKVAGHPSPLLQERRGEGGVVSYLGAMHYGKRETMNLPESIEIHLLDFEGDLYGAEVEVEVLEKIRDVKKFDSIEELIEQIGKDIEKIRATSY